MFDNYGPPAIKVGRLSIWIHSRQFPDATDYWDGNWLNSTVLCTSPNSNAWCSGSIIHLGELFGWHEQLLAMQASLKGAAALNCMEPHLNVLMEMDRTGHIRTQVTIVGDDYVERHEFQFELDQSYLPPLISELEKILAAYPIKEKAR